MRALLLASGLLVAAPASAADVEVGADVDVAFALGDTLAGPGGGASVRLGIGPNPLALGPSALSLLGEVRASAWRFPDVEEGPTDLLRGTVGARGVFTLLWIRKPKDDGGRGRGIRLDLPIALHGGVGSLDGGTTWTPTGDASVGLAIGLLPVEIGLHIGAGGMTASRTVESLSGTAWANGGLDISLIF